MKELKFIIPKKFQFTLLVFLIINSYYATAVFGVDSYGCHVLAGSTQRLYLTEIAPYNNTNYTGLGQGLAGYTDQNGSECLDDLGPSCTVFYGDGMGGTTTNIYKIGLYGHLYDNCPIDDYIPF